MPHKHLQPSSYSNPSTLNGIHHTQKKLFTKLGLYTVHSAGAGLAAGGIQRVAHGNAVGAIFGIVAGDATPDPGISSPDSLSNPASARFALHRRAQGELDGLGGGLGPQVVHAGLQALVPGIEVHAGHLGERAVLEEEVHAL